jgi:hypothetical protein
MRGLSASILPRACAATSTFSIFKAAIESILSDPDMVNKVLEVWPGEDSKVTVERYAIPQDV